MGWFDSNKAKEQVEYLEQERKKLWEKVLAIEEDFNKRTPEHLKAAKEASRKASEYRNRAQETKEQVDALYQELVSTKNEVDLVGKAVSELKEKACVHKDDASFVYNQVEDVYAKITERFELLASKMATLEQILAKHPDITSETKNLDDFLKKSEDDSSKISTALKAVVSKKNEIDEIYDEIVGYEYVDEDTGEKSFIEGLKKQLEDQYDNLSEQLPLLEKKLEKTDSDAENRFLEFAEEQKAHNEEFRLDWNKKYSGLELQIKALLPNALTAGLSYAFSEKKKDEVESFKKLNRQFTIGIVSLAFVSIIPVALSILFIYQGVSLEEVILRIPRVVLAFIPLYLPILWLTYSANKKINLSKRLIEEYTHKEVLSKTFEGLSTQIAGLDSNELSNELRMKLLHDFMQVYAENPGKLISNYEASDHPLMDALEKSYKLDGALEKLEKIPGLSKLSNHLEKRLKQEHATRSSQVENGLAGFEDISDIQPEKS